MRLISYNKKELLGGSMKFISSQTKVSADLNRRAEQLAEQGYTEITECYRDSVDSL